MSSNKFKFKSDKEFRQFLIDLPKTDLHVHLDGSLRIPTLIELARGYRVELPSYTESGLKKRVFKKNYKNLGEYLHGFKYTCQVMQTEEALERVAFEFAEDCWNEGVRYVEVRFAPQLHINKKMTIKDVFFSVDKGLSRAKKRFNNSKEIKSGDAPPFEYGIIATAMRMFNSKFSHYYSQLSEVLSYAPTTPMFAIASTELAMASVAIRDKYGIPIVGFDLAGQEDGYPADDHKAAYEFAHRNFLKKTVHAGEAYGPESIFQAITELKADRIGHGYHLFNKKMLKLPKEIDPNKYIDDLAQYIADRRITIESCPTSNMQTNPLLKDLKEHSIGEMIKNRLSTTICTDNRLISLTTVTDEWKKVIEAFNIGPRELRHTLIYGFKRSFFPRTYLEKRAYVRDIIDYYERVEKKYGI